MDIVDRLRLEANREPHESIWLDAIIEIVRLRTELANRPPHYFGPVYVPPIWERPSTNPFPNIPVITC